MPFLVSAQSSHGVESYRVVSRRVVSWRGPSRSWCRKRADSQRTLGACRKIIAAGVGPPGTHQSERRTPTLGLPPTRRPTLPSCSTFLHRPPPVRHVHTCKQTSSIASHPPADRLPTSHVRFPQPANPHVHAPRAAIDPPLAAATTRAREERRNVALGLGSGTRRRGLFRTCALLLSVASCEHISKWRAETKPAWTHTQ